MGLIDTFESFAAAFESAIKDDDWSRLEKYLAEDATYLNVGGPDSKSVGRDAVINFVKNDVADHDRKFDTRTLIPITPPRVQGNRMSRQWRCTYTLSGAPDLVLEGEARYMFENGLIKEIEEEITSPAMQRLEEWMREYGDRLDA